MSLPKFYVGQRVVAVRDHHRGLFKKGAEFIIRVVKPPPCKCSANIVDVGLKMDSGWMACADCGTTDIRSEYIWWVDENWFAPIHEDFQAITFEKVIEKELASVN